MKDLRAIKLIILDCDGVLTDGKIVYDNHRVESKNFSAHDGLGIKMLAFSGIRLAVVTGRTSQLLQQRCKDLNINMLYQHVDNKKNAVERILEQTGLSWENVAYMGDDWNDWPAMQFAAFKVIPQNAVSAFKRNADYITEKEGGNGAVRELIELLLTEQGIYDKVLQDFLDHLQR